MAGILVVEDEGTIKEKLMKNVDWSGHNFDPVLGAANGLEALALLEKYPVDIMVTDIQMPKLNGIDLIKEVNRRGYRLKIIVISGYAEFEYARESVALNVGEYLLKPFATKRLLEVAVRLREEIQQERAEAMELKQLRTQLHKNMADLREKFLIDLLHRKVAGTEVNAKLPFFGLEEYEAECYQAVVMELHNRHEETSSEVDKYLPNLQFYRRISRILEDCTYRHLLINSYHHQVVAVFFTPEAGLGMELEKYRAVLGRYFGKEVTFGVSNPRRGFADLPLAYREACMALQYRYLYGWDRVYFSHDLHLDHSGYHKSLYLLYQNRILDNLRSGALGEIHQDLQGLFQEIRSSRLDPETIRIIAANLVLLTCATLHELGYDPEKLFAGEIPFLGEINHTHSLHDLEEVFGKFFTRIDLLIKEKRDSVNKQIIDRIRCYLDENYGSKVTLSAIAQEYRISPSYLSLLFTERTGRNFIEYLTERRINKAKELLKHTEMRVYEIAAAVGYKDPYYFSTCFKRIVGLSPSEYRSSYSFPAECNQ